MNEITIVEANLLKKSKYIIYVYTYQRSFACPDKAKSGMLFEVVEEVHERDFWSV